MIICLCLSPLLDGKLHNEKKLLFLFTLGSLKYLNFAVHMIESEFLNEFETQK